MRTLKASALTDKHFGELVSCDPQPEPRRLAGLMTGVTFVGLFWAGPEHVMTPLEPDDEVWIHDEDGG